MSVSFTELSLPVLEMEVGQERKTQEMCKFILASPQGNPVTTNPSKMNLSLDNISV